VNAHDALVELQKGVTRRKLLLLECAIIRYAPFADCGRTIWDLLPQQRWYERTIPPAELIRKLSASGWARPLERYTKPFLSVNAHQAVEWIEQSADGSQSEDDLLVAEEFFRYALYAAEADRMGFDPPDNQPSDLALSFGVAYWLSGLIDVSPATSRVLDFYLKDYSGEFYAWAAHRALHASHRSYALNFIDDILGGNAHSLQFNHAWRTSTVTALASEIYVSRDFTLMPILADALQDAGCDNDKILSHCRSNHMHTKGCWVIDLILNRQESGR
jgi:hypothetical protein